MILHDLFPHSHEKECAQIIRSNRSLLSRAGVVELVKNAELLCARSWIPAPPMLVDMSAGMWIQKLGCHACHQEVSRCHTRDESEECIAHRWESRQLRDPPWLWNWEQMSLEVQNRDISSPSKPTHVLQKLKKYIDLCFVHKTGHWCEVPDDNQNVQ